MAREHADLAAIPTLLDMADSADAVPERPPPRLEEAVLDRFAREQRGADAPARAEVAEPASERKPPRAPPPGGPAIFRPAFGIAATALAAVVAALVIGISLISGSDDPPGRGLPL